MPTHDGGVTQPANTSAPPFDRELLRRHMRGRRRVVSPTEQAAAAQALVRVIARARLLRPGRRIAVYLPYRHEIDLNPVIAVARRRGCLLYAPAIVDMKARRMEFVAFVAGAPRRRNRFGILEPDHRTAPRLNVLQLDLILLPLVAVDARGWRLGSGAGFYDRRLKHLRAHRRWRRPILVGVAYDFQRVPHIEPNPWDVPLDAVITERGFYRASRPAHPEPRSA
ncbi:MAG TPA: 5-formyltetrahydrofolate cyclo-ligase [Povalibacter sp.]|jgi:5-formyltetrahydrofolate cyclo-ligase